jgi:hypothetical protein
MEMTRRQFALTLAAASYLRPSLFEPLSPRSSTRRHSRSSHLGPRSKGCHSIHVEPSKTAHFTSRQSF